MKRSPALPYSSRSLAIIAAAVVILALYLAKVVFIPIALALLLSFVLTPPVAFLERIRFPRALAVLVVMALLVGLTGFIAWKTSRQFMDLADDLPAYEQTLRDKIQAVRASGNQSFHRASDTVKALENEISTPAPEPTQLHAPRKLEPALGSSPTRPLNVVMVPPADFVEYIRNLLGPLATAALVIVFTVFMLMGREDLRDRFIRLAGTSRLHAMTQALDEATRRINRYLFLQLVVNACFGGAVGVSLYFIGVPNAAVWGVSAAILRFLPYAGPPMAALLPIVMSLAVFPGWHKALATAGVFLALELIVSNFIEPLVYGAHIGLSPLAILIAAVFWTLIWGLPGLLLSTPLTACLVVMGRYVPSLKFLNVLLGDDQVLPPHAQFYQRLLAGDKGEASRILERSLKEKDLDETYDSVVIPALSLAERNRHRHELGEETQAFIYQAARELVEELGSAHPAESRHASDAARTGSAETLGMDVLCVPARDDADDVVAAMLAQGLARRGERSQSVRIAAPEELLAQVARSRPQLVCISALPPLAVEHTKALYEQLRERYPDLRINVCLWHFEGDLAQMVRRMKLAPGDGICTRLPEALTSVALRPLQADAQSAVDRNLHVTQGV